ncbi:MAG TPA: D-aminoacylase [Chakrabartia sp.]|jgi:N-acyl-D-aspartate/D-glutamate deacylase|nr:D-aminoacylase [Chakrabartia sp.]
MDNILIKNGIVVDGTGAPAFKADVRLKDGLIAEVGPDLAPAGERVVDASGCHVTPGFIESHTHYDASMWWQADLDPLPGYGATTMIMGNCGFSMAPLHPDRKVKEEVMGIFSFFEDIPIGPFKRFVPWDWTKWSEYRKSFEANIRVPLNYASYVGHIPLRLAAMGMDAWDRAATPEEIAVMCDLLDDALAAGALGLSDNMHDHDGENRAVPSLMADDAEFEALFDVMERYPATCYQVIVDTFMRMTGPANLERLARLLTGRKIRVQIAGAIPTLEFQKPVLPAMQASLETMRKAGVDVWPGYAHVSPTSVLSIVKSLIFAQSNDYVWHEVVLADSHEEKRRLLSDPDWRARARESWDTQAWDHSPLKNPQELYLLDSENGTGPIGGTLKDYADSVGKHRSDAMADWILANGTFSTVHMAPFPKDEDLTMGLMKDPKTVGNVSDAGAHLQMLCGSGENALLLTKYVQAEKKLTLEEAIHIMTGKLAEHFFLNDRGVIAQGKRADIVIFNMDEIGYRQIEKAHDVPDGKGGTTWRFTRAAMPTRMTLVNGVVTFENGASTGNKPGQFISPAANDDAVTAVAAE